MATLFLSNDLVFESRLRGIAERLRLELRVAPSLDRAIDQGLFHAARLVILDLVAGIDPDAAVERTRQESPVATFVAYGPHVQEQSLAAAAAAGCDLVLARGQFNAQMEHILRTYDPI